MECPGMLTLQSGISCNSQPDPARNTARKCICIIGAGPAGLAGLKMIMDTPEYKIGLWSPVAFEARENVGGVWLPAPPTGDPPLTPAYDSLTTNGPHPTMAFSSYPFPPSTPLYPKAAVVQKYLESYANHFQLLPHIRFNHRVTNVERVDSNWKVEISTGAVLEFDSIIVCNGHYSTPRYPDVPGVSAWIESKRAIHSAYYRHPYDMGRVVLIVGGGPSGRDISVEMSTVADVVIHSTSRASPQGIGNIKRRGRVVEFGDNGEVTFEDGSSESNIDRCILATGYEFTYGFLPESILRVAVPPRVPPLPKDLFNSTYGIFPLAQYIFPLQNKFPPSSIVFIGLPRRIVVFRLIEAQMAAYLRVLANPDALDTTQEAVEVITRYEELHRALGDDPLRIAKASNVFLGQEQFDYRDRLYKFAAKDDRSPVTHVHEWEKRIFLNKRVLRRFWVDLEKKGEAEEWVRGVGEGGLHEWVDFMDRLIRLGKEKETDKDTTINPASNVSTGIALDCTT